MKAPFKSARTLPCWRFGWFIRRKLVGASKLDGGVDMWGYKRYARPVKIEAFCKHAKEQAKILIQAEKLKQKLKNQSRRISKSDRRYKAARS